MPTTRPRYQVTETQEIGHAIDVAARRWPDEPRSKLLLRLVRVGGAALAAEGSEAQARRARAVEETNGKYSDVFDHHYLSRLREDWPA